MQRESLKQSKIHRHVCMFFGFDPENLTEFSVPHTYSTMRALQSVFSAASVDHATIGEDIYAVIGTLKDIVTFTDDSRLTELRDYVNELLKHDLSKP